MKEKKDENLDIPHETRGNPNPYKELASYEEGDRKKFYGRTEETEILFQLVNSDSLTVVFGKSGMGKTSLINAGLIPRLRDEDFLPIRLRLHFSTNTPPLLTQIHETILNEFGKQKIKVKGRRKEEPVRPLAPGEKLWEYFRRASHFAPSKVGDDQEEKLVTPVLVFDQFEEIFTLGKYHDDRDTLIDELYWLIEDQLPPSVKERIQKNDVGKKEIYLPSEPPDIRIVISLREEYLPHLTDLKSRIPSIDQTTFRVVHLNAKQAREIINMPDGIQDTKITDSILQIFYPDRAELTKKIPEEKLEIEPSILSVICSQIIKTESFDQNDRSKILTNFYNSAMKAFPQEVEEFIEDKLINEKGSRTLFLLEPGDTVEKYILRLEEERILRKVTLSGRFYIEIVHDLLASIVKEKRNIRMDESRKQELREELKRRYWQIGFVFIVIALLSLSIISWIAYTQYKNERVSRLTAEALLQLPKDNTSAIRIIAAAYNIRSTPPARTCQVLSEIGYSSFERPFYRLNLHHDQAIYTAVFSKDGNRILTASADGTARLWDSDGNALKEFKHGGMVSSAAFSPDETKILTASWDKTAKVWDLQGNISLTLAHEAVVTSAVYSLDGNSILTTSRDGNIRVWGLDGKEQLIIEHNGVFSAAFSPDGSRILTASWDKTAKVWDRDGKFLFGLEHNTTLSSAVFSSDGSRILTASEDGILNVWDRDGNFPIAIESNGSVSSAVFSHDGKRILTSSRDGTIKVLSLQGKALVDLKYENTLYSAIFSPDDRMILIASKDGTAKVWVSKNDILVDYIAHTKDVKTAVFSHDGNKILTASEDGTAKIWDIRGNLLTDLNNQEGGLLSASFSPDDRQVLTVSVEGAAKLWDRKGKFLLDIGGEKKAELFGNTQKMPFMNVSEHTDPAKVITSAVFSPDGQKIFVASPDGRARLFSLNGEKLLELKLGEISSVMLSPDGQRILTTSKDGIANVWNFRNEKLLEFKYKALISSAVFSPDGHRILSVSTDGTIRACNMDKEIIFELRYNAPITSAVFSPDGQRILTASKDGTAKYFDLRGNLLANLDKHKDIVNSAVFSPDGQWILTASRDRTAKMWATPEKIFDWLKDPNIPRLTEEEKKKLGI